MEISRISGLASISTNSSRTTASSAATGLAVPPEPVAEHVALVRGHPHVVAHPDQLQDDAREYQAPVPKVSLTTTTPSWPSISSRYAGQQRRHHVAVGVHDRVGGDRGVGADAGQHHEDRQRQAGEDPPRPRSPSGGSRRPRGPHDQGERHRGAIHSHRSR